MTGSLQIKNNTYYMVLNEVKNGQRKQKWISTQLPVKGNKRKAEALLEETLFSYKTQEQQVPPIQTQSETKGILVTDLIQDWYQIAKNKVDLNTYESYVLISETLIIPYFKQLGLTVNDMTVETLQKFFDDKFDHGRADRKGGVSPSYLRQFRNILKQSLDEAVKQGLIPVNPCQFVKLPRKDRPKVRFYSPAQVKALLEAAKGDPLYNLIRLTVLFGLRRSEVLGLQWDAVDFDAKRFTIRSVVTGVTTIYEKDKPKTAASRRSFALTPVAREIFEEVKREETENRRLFGSSYIENSYVFKQANGEPFKVRYVSNHFSRLLKNNGLPHIRFHDLRHTCASLLLSNSASLKDVQDYLGHSDIQMTANIYGHLDSSRKETLTNDISRLIG